MPARSRAFCDIGPRWILVGAEYISDIDPVRIHLLVLLLFKRRALQCSPIHVQEDMTLQHVIIRSCESVCQCDRAGEVWII